MRAMRVSADVSAPLFSLRGLAVAYRSRQVVGGVDLDVARDEVVGLVGESGSGKTQTMLAALGLTGKSAEVRGSAKLDGFELIGARESALNALRGAKATMIFQEPMSALDPLSSIGSQIAAPMIAHKRADRAQARRRAAKLLDNLRLAGGAGRLGAFAHELSGGERQRVMIAMAIANDPAPSIADEPARARDGSGRAPLA